MGVRTRNNSRAEARKRVLREERARQAAWQTGQPRRCESNIVGAAGECLACDAEQGVHCLADAYPGQAPCHHCFESSGYMGRVHPATWDDPAWEDADPTRPCSYCNVTGTVDSPLVTLSDLEDLAADEAEGR